MPSKLEDDRAPETVEERTKRLRKEDRRKLRVSFKPDESLVEVRIFEHHPDEESGHDNNMVRDANDIKGEGQMLKMHRERDVMDEDEDVGDVEAIETAVEEQIKAWISPSCEFFPDAYSVGSLRFRQLLTSVKFLRTSINAIFMRGRGTFEHRARRRIYRRREK